MMVEKSPNFSLRWGCRRRQRRLAVLGVVLLVLGAMGWFAVTNAGYLAHDPALTGGDYLGAAICHRLTSRSFVVNGRQLPLCARCTGIYLGVALSFGLLLLAGRSRRSELPSLPLLLILFGLIGLMGVDGLNSYSHFFPGFPHVYEPRNWLRLTTGMGAGLAMGLLIFPALGQTLWRQGDGRPVIDSYRELAGLGLLGGVTVLLVLSNQPAVLYVLALVSAAGVVLIVTAINTVLLLIIVKRDGLAERWSETAVPLLIGFALALIQLVAIALLRFNLLGTITGFPGLT